MRRTCHVCGIEKDATEFYKGQGTTCKKCNNIRARKWKKDNPQRYRKAKKSREANDKDLALRRRRTRLRRRYKLSMEDVEQILIRQDYKCAICRVQLIPPSVHPNRVDEIEFEDAEWTVIDHDHKDGHVRGALCSPCNAGLGLFEDSIRKVRGAFYYLQNDLIKMKM